MYSGFLSNSIIKRAIEADKVEFKIINIRDYSDDPHKRVDDTPYGGGAGMLMRVDVVDKALKANKGDNGYVLLTSAKGKTFDQKKARELALKDELVIIAGHYEGIDYRIEEKTDELISIGDYILTGGELPSMVISDAVTRLLDGVISDDSTVEESFENSLLEYPQYTRPYEYEGKSVPDVLLSGHHDNIRKYRLKESLRTTYLHRPDLLEKVELDKEKKELLEQIISEYVNK